MSYDGIRRAMCNRETSRPTSTPSTAFIVVLLSLATLLDSSPLLRAASFQHSYAVVVGITNYSSGYWKDHRLPYARPDAEAVAKLLQAQGYTVTSLYDERATKHNILAAFEALADKLQVSDRVVVFISSHGTNKSTASGKRGYIVPYDGSDYASYLSDAELKDASAAMQTARHQLFIIDACYAGLMITRSGGVPPDVPNYLNEVTTRIAREVVTAGGGDQEVLDSGPNGHSVFTNALLEGLNGQADLNRDGYITFSELESYLGPRAWNSYQTPAFGVLPGDGSGQYIFQSPLGQTAPLIQAAPIPKIVIKKGDSDQLESAKQLLQESRFSEAFPLFRSAAGNGDPEAAYYLGQSYYNGWGVPQNYAASLPWFEKAATAGSSEAMRSLGFMYEQGLGVSQDYRKARELFEKGAAAGNAGAMSNLGFMYEKALGVPRSYVEAKQWYEKGAAGGDAWSMNDLGVCYRDGLGVNKDYARAKELFEKAAAAGNSEAMLSLGNMYQSGQGVAPDYAKARELYERAAAAGNAGAMEDLGFMYENALGVPRSYTDAKQWYEKAAAAGNSDAARRLKELKP